MLPDEGDQYLNTTLCIETISVAPRADSMTRDAFRGLINIEHDHVIHTVHATSEAGTLIAKHGPLREPCQKSCNIYRLASSFRWTADGGEAKASGKRAAYNFTPQIDTVDDESKISSERQERKRAIKVARSWERSERAYASGSISCIPLRGCNKLTVQQVTNNKQSKLAPEERKLQLHRRLRTLRDQTQEWMEASMLASAQKNADGIYGSASNGSETEFYSLISLWRNRFYEMADSAGAVHVRPQMERTTWIKPDSIRESMGQERSPRSNICLVNCTHIFGERVWAYRRRKGSCGASIL
ncbi:hypothetical protein B0H17DRAFT_1134683 [Mycena rosella]|uniref:Uncharacterized protein n=1 Tax=Mycena rosella TaxID=1033263 RepID=A0AAD7DGW8_MYCRO|nr:hypothetical protein B0H17DRAFT_1134683 [Mycena rosella]